MAANLKKSIMTLILLLFIYDTQRDFLRSINLARFNYTFHN